MKKKILIISFLVFCSFCSIQTVSAAVITNPIIIQTKENEKIVEKISKVKNKAVENLKYTNSQNAISAKEAIESNYRLAKKRIDFTNLDQELFLNQKKEDLFYVNNILVSDSEYLKQLLKTSKEELKKTNIFYGYENLNKTRKNFVITALSMQNQFSYVWGGKPISQTEWNNANGLDCSGFIQWVYWQSIGENDFGSTGSISNATRISQDELLPGDLGLLFNGGTYYCDALGNLFSTQEEADASNFIYGLSETTRHTNHVGIYVGKDDDGNMLWCHCTGSADTVVVNNYSNFSYFVRILE